MLDYCCCQSANTSERKKTLPKTPCFQWRGAGRQKHCNTSECKRGANISWSTWGGAPTGRAFGANRKILTQGLLVTSRHLKKVFISSMATLLGYPRTRHGILQHCTLVGGCGKAFGLLLFWLQFFLLPRPLPSAFTLHLLVKSLFYFWNAVRSRRGWVAGHMHV